MAYEVEAFGKIIEVPDDVPKEKAYEQIMANKHKLGYDEFTDPANFVSPEPEALDYAKGFASGANKLVSGVGYLAEAAGAKDTGKAIREFGDRGAAYWNEQMSPGGKKAAESQVFVDDPESITGLRLGDDAGKALLMGAAQSLPSMFAAALPGVAITKGIQALASLGLAGGAGATIPLLAGTAAPVGIGSQVIARVPSAVGFGAAEGVVSGGMNAAGLKSSIEGMSDKELLKSPVYQALRAQHGEEKARTMLADQAASDLFGKTSVSTGAIGALTGGGALGSAYQKVTSGAADGILMTGLKGAGQEAMQETPQSGGEKYIENITRKEYLDPSIDPMSGVIAEAASGGAIGAFTGGIVGAGSAVNITKQKITPIADAPTLDDAIVAAHEAIRTEDPTLADVEALNPTKKETADETQATIDAGQAQAAEVLNPNENVIVTPDGTRLNAVWDVVDADEVKASLSKGVNQPRDRKRAAANVQVQQIANAPDYKRLRDSPVMDAGAPTLSLDNKIIAGNGRFEGVSLAYSQGTVKPYLDELRADIIGKGLDPAIIEGKAKPILVRRLVDEHDVRKLAIKSNSGLSLDMSPIELASVDAERMVGVESLVLNDLGEVALTPANMTSLKDVFNDYDSGEMNSMADKHLNLSQSGRIRIRNAMLAKAYGDSPTLEKLIESTDSEMRNVMSALVKSVGHVLKSKQDTKALLEAVDTYSQLKATGQPVDNFLAQQDAFSEGLSKEAEGILRFIDTNVRSQKKLTDFFKGNFVETDTTSDDMFNQEAPKDASITSLEKHLKDAGYDFTVEPASVRDVDALDSTKKARKELAEKQAKLFKKKVVFIKADGPFKINGVMVPSIADTIFVDIRTDKAFDAIMAHELSHWMEQEKPAVYKELVKSLKTVIINEAEYAKKYGIEGATKAEITKEIVGDLMGDNFTEQSFWQKVAAANPEAFKDIAAAIIKWLKGVIVKAKANGMGSEQWVKDATKAQDIIAKAVAQYTESDAAPVNAKSKPKFNITGDNKPAIDKARVILNRLSDLHTKMNDTYDMDVFVEFGERAVEAKDVLASMLESGRLNGIGADGKWLISRNTTSDKPWRVTDFGAKDGEPFSHTEYKTAKQALSDNNLIIDKDKIALFSRAYHGSPHDHNKFDSSKIGTGEGAQAYGYGHYFAESKDVAEYYKKQLSEPDFTRRMDGEPISRELQDKLAESYKYLKRKNGSATRYDAIEDVVTQLNKDDLLMKEAKQVLRYPPTEGGKLYEVELAPEQDEYLLWDKPLSEQSDKVKSALGELDPDTYLDSGDDYDANETGQIVYHRLTNSKGYDEKKASDKLHSLGIRGIKYLDGSSRAKGEGAYNYVIFDDKDVSITAKFSRAPKKLDAEYMDAVNSGDMEKAQQMVDSAAREKGYISGNEYRMMHQAPNRDDYNLATIKDAGIVPDDYWTHPQYYQNDYEERTSFYQVKAAIDSRKQRMFVFRSVPKSVKDDFIRNGDWVSPSRAYAKLEGESIPGGYRIIAQRVDLKDLWWDANSINELGYDDGKEYAHKNTKNNRKLLDAVTYDDDGNAIPLSKRFNSRKSEVKFSKTEIENTLIAQHNLSVRNLIHADRMGGLAAPSIAVTDKAHPLTGFGEITLLSHKDLIDPKNGTKIFGSDIYSPRYPSISYDFSGKPIKALNALLAKGVAATGDSEYYNDNLQNDPFRELTHSSAAMYTFLSEQGVEPELAYVKVKELPIDSLKPFADGTLDSFDMSKDEGFRKSVKDYWAEKFDGEILGNDELINLARAYSHDVIAYRDSKKNVGKIDRQATNTKLFRQISDANLRNKFDEYLVDLVNRAGPKERIFKGHTNAGNRQYMPHDIDTVIKILKKDLRGGENFKYGLGSIRAKYSPQFKSIEQIRKSKGMLMNSESFDQVKKEVQAGLDGLNESLASYGTFSGFDNVETMLSDAAKRGISGALKDNGFENVPDSIKVDIQTFLNKLKDMPTEYFEAKILRAVGLGEFSTAVIPDDSTPQVEAILKKNGIEDIRKYKSGDNEDRVKQINKVTHVMFSRVTVDGIERPTTNSEGKPINNPVNFWKWFGNSEARQWPSSSRGDRSMAPPLVLYHGTKGDFNEFVVGSPGTNSTVFGPWETKRAGMFFTQDKKFAESFATQGDSTQGANIIPVYLKVENAIDLTEGFTDDAIIDALAEKGINPRLMHNISADQIWGMFDKEDDGSFFVSKLKELGYDGAIIVEPNTATDESTETWVVFDPNHIKSAIGNNGNYLSTNNDIRFSRAPKLYSKLEQALEAANDKVFSTGPQVKLWLQSNAGKLGIKKDEIYWSGIDNWLDAQGKVSKQQVVEFVRSNGVQVEDVTLGKITADKDRIDELHTQLADILKSKRELDNKLEFGMITPQEYDDGVRSSINERRAIEDELDQSIPRETLPKHNNANLTLPGGTDYKELVVTVPTIEPHNADDSTHFGDTGQGKQIGWLRMDTRDGGLFIEELQSQRAQQGRSKGFDVVPPAPFVSDANNKATNAYITLLMKKALIEAVSNDHASVSWTTGDQQADRYDLSKQISEVHYSGTNLKAYDYDGNTVISETGVQEKDLPDYIGKEAAEKLIAQPKNGTLRSLGSIDLKVGGEWAQSMYGNEQGLNLQGKPSLMSQAANDIFKHVGSGKVESINGQPGFYVTPEMKSKDLPLFSRSKGWDNFPDAIIAHRSVSSHPQYQPAKDGDFNAAMQLAYDTVTSKYTDDIKNMIGSDRPTVVPVRSAEGNGSANAIPEAIGMMISEKLNLPFDENDIHQVERIGRTGADGWHRIANLPTFEGDVAKGATYLVVDDTLAQGGTVAQLKEYIETNGGKVTLITTLTGKQYSAKIGLSDFTLSTLRDKHGSIEPWFTKSFGYGFAGLTESEARFLISTKGLSSEQVRERIAEAKLEGTNRDVPRLSKDLNLADSPKPTPPDESRLRRFQRMNQDSFNRFTVIKEWLAENGQTLSDKADVYGAEERYHSMAANQLEDFREQQRNPLIEKIQKAGYTLGDIEVFLKMQHAREANAQIRKLGDNPDATAYGIEDQEAADYLAEAPENLAKLANEFRAITDQTKKLRLDAGILNTDITDAWEGAYKHYVPVKGEADSTRGVGKGLKTNFKSKRRLGHSLRDEHVIENILMDHERAILEVERNRVGKHLVMMAAEMQRPDILSIDQPEKRKMLKESTAYTVEANGVVQGVFKSREEAKMFKQFYAASMPKVAPSAIVINQTKDQRVISSASPMLAENEVNVYMNGHAIRVQINDDLLARAYTKMGVEQFSDIVAAGRILNGYLSKVYTGYNPEFILTNMIRDFSSGTINLTGEQGFGMATKALTNYPRMFTDLLKYAATNGKSSTKWIDAYRKNGGNTGAAYLSDMERLGNEVNTEYASYQGVLSNLKQGDTANAARAAGRKVFNATLKWIYNLNQAGENAMRLAAFKAMIDSGRTVNEAAKVAKNITVNFNRKGERQWAPALYLFYNASLQGTAATAHALTKGKHKGQAWALAGSMAAVGYMMAASFGGGDEDDWDEINEYTKERNMLIKSGDGYVKVPVPYGYGFFWNFGRHMSEAQRTGELGVMPWHLATSAISEFTPFNEIVVGSDEEFRSDQVFMGLLPTAMKIVAQPTFNKQLFTGSELMPESQFDKSQPDRQKMFRSTKGTMYDTVAGWLDSAGIDVSPETLKYITRTGTGGAGSLVDTGISAAMLKAEGAELDTQEIPFVRKAYMELGIKDKRAAYYKVREEARTAAEEFNRARRDNDVAKMQDVLKDKKELIALDRYANKLAATIDAARDQQDAVRADKNLSVQEKRLKLKDMEATEAKFYDQYLDVFKTTRRP